ncbi:MULTISPECIES: helix-turn-helix domain-containing protein [Pseudomonas]|uniref:Helix-turn-helix n=1 Tax=Pseudomonas lutea TaxID=243924 RepID=A0A9X8MHJ5_9PSED|nr:MULTISPECIES: helix-turn-helix transcriptional regulator [Pseudomonas]SER44389.1 Helix-turn-helix [Pseudomonas lutea]
MYNLDPNSDIFHAELRRARVEKGMTQTELAAALGISAVMTQRYEMEREKKYSARPTPITAKKIQDFFSQTKEKSAELHPHTNEKAQESIRNSLQYFSLDDLIGEIRRRGFVVTLQSKG